MSLRKRVWEIVETAPPGDTASRVFDVCMVSLIGLNIVALVLETIEPLHRTAEKAFFAFEVFSVLAFSIEYVMRVWASKEAAEYRGRQGRLRFAISAFAVIDLLAVLPFYLPFLGVDLRFLRGVRLVRLFRILKLGRYSMALKTFGRVFQAKRADLGILVFMISILLLFASSLMYYAEHDVQPQAFSSIPAAMWWGVETLTTVGYGDIYPITVTGRLLGSVVAILGIGLFALPAGILGSGFMEELAERRQLEEGNCPRCGLAIRHP